MKTGFKKMFGRRFRAGSYSAVAAVVVIAIAVLANCIVGAMPSTLTELDLTSQSYYSLSGQTKQIVTALDKDVSFYLLANSGNEDDGIVRLMNRYAALSDHIKISYVDPSEKPTFLNAYDLSTSELYANSVIVECGDRWKLVSYVDIYATEYSMDYSSYNYTTTTSFNGENELTNAVHYVTSDNLPKVYTLSGHGETELSDTVTTGLTNDNLETASLSLLTEESVPEDADVIVIHVPQSDLSEEEATMLIDWIGNGGRIVLVTDYIAEGEMTNLLKVTEAMGMTAQTGLIIEGDQNHYIRRYPYYLLPEIEDHEITSALSEAGYYILMPLTQGIATVDGTSATVTDLLTTTDSSFSKAAGKEATSVEKEDGDAEGPFTVAAASESGEARMVWFASADLLNQNIDQTVSGANSDCFLNAVEWMCDQEETISIRAKSMDQSTLTLTDAQSKFWSMIMIGVIPLALILIGVAISVRRKRR